SALRHDRSCASVTEPPPSRIFILFLLMPLRPPTSTLFPYTTLFRSHHVLPRAPQNDVSPLRALLPDRVGEVPVHVHVVVFHRPQDRKSTRLNSSHLVISYAVFCLKKNRNDDRSRD